MDFSELKYQIWKKPFWLSTEKKYSLQHTVYAHAGWNYHSYWNSFCKFTGGKVRALKSARAIPQSLPATFRKR